MTEEQPGASINVQSRPSGDSFPTPLKTTSRNTPELARSSTPRANTIDAISDKATSALIRRVLCGHQHLGVSPDKPRAESPSIEGLLPPLTSSNEVDLQLYAFIAIFIKEYVNPWYARITSDHVFVDEIIQIIAHCTRGFEERLRRVDLESLLLRDLPILLDAHVDAHHISQNAAHLPSSPLQRRLVYHTLRPHPALWPVPDDQDLTVVLEQQQNDAAYRSLLAQGVLAILLPTEDLRNPCLRALVSEVFADLILGSFISGKLCDGTFLYDSISKAAGAVQSRLGVKSWASDKLEAPKPKDRLAQFGLLSDTRSARQGENAGNNITDVFWLIAQHVFRAYSGLRSILLALAESNTLPPRSRSTSSNLAKMPQDFFENQSMPAAMSSPLDAGEVSRCPMIEYKLWPTIASITGFPSRMPWLAGCFSMIHHILLYGWGRVGGTNSRLDRYVGLFIPRACLMLFWREPLVSHRDREMVLRKRSVRWRSSGSRSHLTWNTWPGIVPPLRCVASRLAQAQLLPTWLDRREADRASQGFLWLCKRGSKMFESVHEVNE